MYTIGCSYTVVEIATAIHKDYVKHTMMLISCQYIIIVQRKYVSPDNLIRNISLWFYETQ